MLYYDWPGNTRELKNIVERAVILSDSRELSAELLPGEILFPIRENEDSDVEKLDEIEKLHIQKILQMTKGNKTQAAARLGIGVPTLYRKIEQYRLK